MSPTAPYDEEPLWRIDLDSYSGGLLWRIDPDDDLKCWITRHREHYQSEIAKALGPGAKDIAVSTAGMMAILKHLEKAHPEPSWVIGDLGAGFTSFVLRAWSYYQGAGRVVTMDHDHDWLALIGQIMHREIADLYPHLLLPRKELERWSSPGCFNAILVDHGPEMRTRRDDLPWLAKLLKPGGSLIFDDWHLNHAFQCIRQLELLDGWDIQVLDGSEEHSGGKQIAVATRSEAAPPARAKPIMPSPSRGPHRGRPGKAPS